MTDSSAELVFVGCYTAGKGGEGEGIVLAHRDRRTGELQAKGVVARPPAPSFVVRHPDLPILYAASELDEGEVSAWRIGPDGDLSPLGVWPSGGAFPCHLAVAGDASGYWLATANYGSGSVGALPLDEQGVPDGRHDAVVHRGHGPNRERQEAPHAHMVVPVADGVISVDLGADRVFQHRYDRSTARFGETIEIAVLPRGAGPRHLV